jgi:hypothetical protein
MERMFPGSGSSTIREKSVSDQEEMGLFGSAVFFKEKAFVSIPKGV